MTVENLLSPQEQIKTPERSAEKLYLDALEKKRDTLLAFHTINSFRKGKEPKEMTSEEIGQYKTLREEWRARKKKSFSAFENLSQDKQEELAAMGSRLYDVQAKLTLLRSKSAEQENQPISPAGVGVEEPEAGTAEQPTPPAEMETPTAKTPTTETTEQSTAEKPESALSLAEVDDYIIRLEKSKPTPLLAIEAWKAKRDELAERQEAEANPDRTPPKGFLQRVMDSYDEAKDAFVWVNVIETLTPAERVKDSYDKAKDTFIGADAISEGRETVEDRMSPLGLRKEAMESLSLQPAEGTRPEQPAVSQPGQPRRSETEGTAEASTPAEKDTFWTLGFWKERVKGLVTPFGFLEFYRAEKFRRRTGEVAGDTETLATSIQEEKNLSLEEAQTEAREVIRVLNEEKLTDISAADYEKISSNITNRKRKENDEQIAYTVKSAEDDIYDKLQKSGHRGEAGQELLTRENQLAIRSELMAVLNKLRDGAVRTDRKELAKLIRRNLDEKWHWRYVWGGIDAALWFAGIAAISMKFLASKEAVAVGAKVAAGGAGSAEAAREFVETGMHKNIWSTLEQMAKNGPGHFTPTGEQLKEWSQGVLDSIKHYEPEWVDHAIEGLKSSRAMPEGFPLKVPTWVMKAMGYPGF